MCHWRVPEKLHSQQALSPRRSHCPHGRQTPTLPSAPTAYVFILTCYIFVYFQIDINGTISFASFCGGWDWLLSLDTMLRFIHVVCSPRPFIFIAVYYSLAQIYTSYLSILMCFFSPILKLMDIFPPRLWKLTYIHTHTHRHSHCVCVYIYIFTCILVFAFCWAYTKCGIVCHRVYSCNLLLF